MTSQDITTWAAVAQGLGALASVALAGWAAFTVHRYTQRKDLLLFLVRRWEVQQDINLQQLTDPDLLVEFERYVYGDQVTVDQKQARRHFFGFLILNQVQNEWLAMKHGLLTKEQFEASALVTLKLMARRKAEIIGLLAERGYDENFAKDILPLFDRVKAPNPPTPPEKLAVA